jgi:hypothetical protein
MPIASLYVSEKQVAQMLGQTVDWLRANASMLEASTGFPKIDAVIGKRHREAIEVWARERNFRSKRGPERLEERNRENFNAL